MKKYGLYILCIAILIITGCAGTTYYTGLQPVQPVPGPAITTQGPGPVVAVGPIGVPGWIRRALIVSEFEIKSSNISSVDMRAGLLAREIPDVMTTDLERLFAPAGIKVVRTAIIGTSASYRIAVDINALDLTSRNDAIDTRAQWAIFRTGSADPVLVQDVAFLTPVPGSDETQMEPAMSRALADLSRIIVRDFEAFLAVR